MKVLVVASIHNPNPLGNFFYSLVQKLSKDKGYLSYYSKNIRTAARANSLSELYGQKMSNNTLEELVEAYQYEASELITDYNSLPIKMVVRDVLERSNLTFPIKPFDVCYFLGVSVTYLDLPKSIQGFTLKSTNAKRGIIALNASYSGSLREKFTLAHELGHYLLHGFDEDELVSIDNGIYANISNQSVSEKEANQFAELLLIPEGSEGERNLRILEAPFEKSISSLSREWEISIEVLISRFIKVTNYSMRLIVIKDGEVVYKENSRFWENDYTTSTSEPLEENIESRSGLTYKLIYYSED